MTDIIIKAYDVLEEIIKSHKFLEIKELNEKLDHLYRKEVNDYNDAKIAYQNVLNEGGTYHPDYKKTIKHLSETKATLYNKPEVKKYNDLELEFEAELNEFLYELSKSVSSHVPTPNRFGMIKKGGSCHVHK